jgi:FkbM family methyltransferase
VSIGRRKVRLEDEHSWVFNRMAHAYDARPEYPLALVSALTTAAPGPRVLDVGAGLGHLARPLARLGFRVTALEPAQRMLTRLRELVAVEPLQLATVHGMAEALPFANAEFDFVVVADVVHFLDSERAAKEIARVLAPGGGLAVITVELADTPFMRAVKEIMEASAPRRPRETSNAVAELLAVAKLRNVSSHGFEDDTPLDAATLERVFDSVSFIGPAMNPARKEEFRRRIAAVEHPPSWARRFTLWCGRR